MAKVVRKVKGEIRFRKGDLIIRRQRLKAQLSKVGREIKKFKGVKTFRRIIPKKIKLTVTKNINKITQVTKGKISVGKRKKDIVEVFSASNIFTRGDVSKIVGKAITKKGDRIRFSGLLKDISQGRDIGSVGPQQKVIFRQALEEVLKVVGSKTKAKQLGLSSRAQTAISTGVAQITKISPKITPPISQAALKIKTIQGVKTTPKFSKLSNQNIRQSLKQFTKIKQAQKEITKTKQKVNQLTKQKQTTTQKQKVTLISKQLTKQKVKLAFKLKTLQKQSSKLKTSFGIVLPKITTVPPPPIIPLLPRLKGKKKVTIKKSKRGWDVFAKPIKRTKKGKGRKLIKINKVPLTKKQAKDLRNFVVDTSLSRRGKIKRAGKRPKKPILKAPRGYFRKSRRKFRTFRKVKGKRKPLRKGVVIEKKRHILDTKQEKLKINLRRRVAQLTKQAKKRLAKRRAQPRRTTRRKIVVRRTPRRKPSKSFTSQPKKKKVSQKVLNILAKGRAKRLANLKKK